MSRRQRRFVRFIIASACLLFLIATADAVAAEPDWYVMPETDGPALSASYGIAAAYWNSVPSVPSIAQACPDGIDLRLSDTGLPADDGKPAAGFGQSRGTQPCTIWIERSFYDDTADAPTVERDLRRCSLIVHEVGHVLGLDHKFRGDALHIMDYIEDKTVRVPQQCRDRYDATKTISLSEARQAVRERIGERWRLRTLLSHWRRHSDGSREVMEYEVRAKRGERRQAFLVGVKQTGARYITRTAW